MIPKEVLEKYGMQTLEEYLAIEDALVNMELMFYVDFLKRTDHIPNKILEGAATSEDYADELYYREVARQEIDKLSGGTGEEVKIKPLDKRTAEIETATITMLGTDTDKEQASEQLRRTLQMFAQTLTDEEAMEIATVYPAYEVGKAYKVDEFISYGVNDVGDPQLYKVVQAHTSQEDWKPDTTPALYTPIGLTEEGYPVWSQPTGAHDAYSIGDIVDYNGTLYKSLIDGNVYSPEEYPAGWEVYIATE